MFIPDLDDPKKPTPPVEEDPAHVPETLGDPEDDDDDEE